MSIYTVLSSQVPTLSYSTIRQQSVGGSQEEFLDRLNERHARLRAESDALETAFRKFLSDTTTKEAQSVRGLLSPFLHTPISSDDAEVRAMLREGFERLAGQLVDVGQPGVTFATEGRMTFPTLKKTRERKLLANGRTYLHELGFDMTNNKAELLETTYVLQGSRNLDVLEYLLREKLIPDNGGHDSMAVRASVSQLHNLLHMRGSFPKPQSRKLFETLVAFPRPDVKYASFVGALREGVDKLDEHFTPDQISLWQQKLDLGRGKEFVLRIVDSTLPRTVESILWVETLKTQAYLKQAIIDQGSLMIKELLI